MRRGSFCENVEQITRAPPPEVKLEVSAMIHSKMHGLPIAPARVHGLMEDYGYYDDYYACGYY